jgi:hypothetical protein
MSASQHGDQHLLDGVLLPDDDLGQFVVDFLKDGGAFFDGGEIVLAGFF